jgi:hypothetical protein
MNKTLSICLLILAFLSSATALARNVEHYFKVSEAVASEKGQRLLNIPYHFSGQNLPNISRKIGTWTGTGKASGFMRSDIASCQTAFVTALLSMQKRAQAEGANAIVNLRSVTRNKTTESPTDYRCVAGSTIVHVSLRGDVVITH